MKTLLHTILLSLAVLCPFWAHAQGIDDAVCNAQTYYEGTGRSMAIGNAIGAVGGDMTAVCINPASLGLYRSQEFTFTTGFQHHFALSNYYGEQHYNDRIRVSVPNMGMIFTAEVSNYKPLRFLQFGIGLTRTNDFNFRTKAEGLNPASSIVDSYLQTINGIDELFLPSTNVGKVLGDNYPYDLSPAWETYLIDRFVDSAGHYSFDSPIPQGDVYQEESISSKGRNEEWTMAIGANYYDKLFVGTSLGLAHLKRSYTRSYLESPGLAGSDRFFNWAHDEELSNNAWGVNLKCGIIYFPAHWLRIGLAYHTRTLYNFTETWSTETRTVLKTTDGAQDYHRYLSPNLSQEYDFYAPRKIVGSMALFVGSRGLVSADVEYLDYRVSKFVFDDDPEDYRDILQPALNLRLGTEWRMLQFFFRGGASYYGSPYGLGQRNGSVKKLALGIGYASSDETTWDFAYELTHSTSVRTPYQYDVDGVNIVNDLVSQHWRNKVVVTMKVKL